MASTALPAEYLAAHAAIAYLASVCDGAHKQDAAGFDAGDTHLGKHLAALSPEALPTEAWVEIARLARKYRGQTGISDEVLAALPQPGKADDEVRLAVKVQAKRKVVVTPSLLSIALDYNDFDVRKVVKRCGFDWQAVPKVWTMPLAKVTPAIRSMLEPYFDLSAVPAPLDGQVTPPITVKPHLTMQGTDHILWTTDYDTALVAALQGIPGRRYDRPTRTNVTPVSQMALDVAKRFNLTVHPDVVKAVSAAKGDDDAAYERSNLLRQVSALADPNALPEGFLALLPTTALA